MLIHKCDRCGKLFDLTPTSEEYVVKIRKISKDVDFTVDLCDECTESIRQWVIDPNATVNYDPATEKPVYDGKFRLIDRVRKLFDKDKVREAAAKRKETRDD